MVHEVKWQVNGTNFPQTFQLFVEVHVGLWVDAFPDKLSHSVKMFFKNSKQQLGKHVKEHPEETEEISFVLEVNEVAELSPSCLVHASWDVPYVNHKP